MNSSTPRLRRRELIEILDELDQGIDVNEYRDLVEILFSNEFFVERRSETDWSEEFVDEPGEDSLDEFDRRSLVDWMKRRVVQFESVGLLGSSLELIEILLENEPSNDEFSRLKRTVELEYLLNSNFDQSISLDQLNCLTGEQVLDLILQNSNDLSVDELEKRFESMLIPSLGFFGHIESQLELILVEKLKREENLSPIFRLIKEKRIVDKEQLSTLLERIVLNVRTANQLDIAKSILSTVQQKSQLDYFIEFESTRTESNHTRRSFLFLSRAEVRQSS